jgi:hypothetical protein
MKNLDRANGSQFDKNPPKSLSPSVKFTEARAYYLAALRRNPETPAPKVRMATIAEFHDWKSEMRAYDAAQLDLHLATPEDIQKRNAAIRVPIGGGRIVQHASYA